MNKFNLLQKNGLHIWNRHKKYYKKHSSELKSGKIIKSGRFSDIKIFISKIILKTLKRRLYPKLFSRKNVALSYFSRFIVTTHLIWSWINSSDDHDFTLENNRSWVIDWIFQRHVMRALLWNWIVIADVLRFL